MKTIEITNIEAFQKAWAKIRRRAVKLGLTVPVATPIGEVYLKEVKKTIISQYENDESYKYAVECQLFQVDEISYSFDGWSLIGVAEPLTGMTNLLLSIGEKSSDWSAASFRHTSTGKVCEHCNKIRNRSKLFVIGRTDDFSITKQVGSACLADFCDSNSNNVAGAFEFESDIFATLKEYSYNEGSSQSRVSVLNPIKVLEVASEVAMSTGYISQAKAEEKGTISTAEMVKMAFDSQCKPKDRVYPSDKTIARAQLILDWAMSEGPAKAETESYWAGVMSMLEIEMVPTKRLGYIVGLVGCYDAHLRAIERAANSENSISEFQGEVGSRLTFEATVTRISNFESQWGVGTITMLKTNAGHILKYWNQIGEVGETFNFSAGIKAHENDQFVKAKVTVLSRCTKIKQLVLA